MSDTVYNAFEEEKCAWVQETVDEIIRKRIEYQERELAELIEKYDFITGSIETKIKLMEILPGANIIYSPHVKVPTMVYAIKRFDIADLVKEPYPYEKDEPILNHFTEMMKAFWDNPDLDRNNILAKRFDIPMEKESED